MHRSTLPAAALAAASMTAALLLGSATDGRATRDRPPPGYTGGFAEPSCAACHIDAAVNEGAGALTVSGLPTSYEPARTYPLTVTLAQTGLLAGGFELSIRFDGGAQAGTLRPLDAARVDVTALDGVQYIHHLYAGTEPVATDTARWQFEWTAPESGAAVVVHAAANAADGDSSPLGDFIYVIALRSATEK